MRPLVFQIDDGNGEQRQVEIEASEQPGGVLRFRLKKPG